MKILHINGTSYGGAANFVFNLHKKLMNIKTVSSYVYVPKKRNVENIIYPQSIFFKFNYLTKILITKILNRIFIKSNQTITLSLLKSYEIKKVIKKVNPDLINIHWLGNEFMSLKEINSLKVPIVWTLHDMWLLSPYSHYFNDNEFDKIKKRQLSLFSKYLLNKKIKLKYKNIKFIPTSDWMLSRFNESNIYKENQLKKIPCGINFEEWFPENKNNSKEIFSLDRNKKIILFLAMGGNNPRKGLDTLAKSLKLVKQEFQLVIAGDQFPTIVKDIKFKFIDYPKDINTLRSLYSASDCLVVPSNLEAFGLVSLEAAACNTPSVIFENTGLTEIINHKENGYISKFGDISDYANGIDWVLNEISKNPRKFSSISNQVKSKFDINDVSHKYLDIYNNLINYNKIVR